MENSVIALAEAFAGTEDDELLTEICNTVYASLTAGLRSEYTPEACGQPLQAAAAVVAANLWREWKSGGRADSFSAGSVSISGSGSGDALEQKMLELIRPFMKDGSFAFRRV